MCIHVFIYRSQVHNKSSALALLCFDLIPVLFFFVLELFVACADGDFDKVKGLISEISPSAVNRLHQGGSTLLYK